MTHKSSQEKDEKGHEKVTGDKLDYLFEQQKSLISQDYSQVNGKENVQPSENKMKRLYESSEPFSGYRIFMLSSALLHEVIELQRETGWKWWKTDNGIEDQRIKEEIIDLWHFLIQLSIEAGLDSELLVSKYIEKNKENTKRQQQGY
ncbi:MAG TPA: dUTPase [Candidatus Saccharimonadales bacterium]|nr:dUTPase [Candidatus Saccharimonadales bacterium]